MKGHSRSRLLEDPFRAESHLAKGPSDGTWRLEIGREYPRMKRPIEGREKREREPPRMGRGGKRGKSKVERKWERERRKGCLSPLSNELIPRKRRGRILVRREAGVSFECFLFQSLATQNFRVWRGKQKGSRSAVISLWSN